MMITSLFRKTIGNRCLSTIALDRLGLGGSKWRSSQYPLLVQTALQQGVSCLEVGTEGGDAVLAQILEKEMPRKIQCLLRVGYRQVATAETGTEEIQGAYFPGDVVVEKNRVLHNIGPNYLEYALTQSPLMKLAEQYPDQLELVVLLHNPEVQKNHNLQDKKDETLAHQLSESFEELQMLVRESPLHSYGIVSNGFSLPATHPLHLSWQHHVSPASQQETPNFRIVQFPFNLLESSDFLNSKKDAPAHVQYYAMRPLSCYPDRGTSTSHPFVLRDYELPATMNKHDPLQWTHQMTGLPEAYQVALKAAMVHFDAVEILELKSQGIELDTDQRETLDGCKLMQSLLHDVDAGLDQVRSFAAHEEFLLQKVIPLIHDTFESYDDDTAKVLEAFFGAFNLAVKYSIAKNVRHLLIHGEDDGGDSPKYPVPEDMRLQEFALRHVWKEKGIDKIIVGASDPNQIVDIVNIGKQLEAEGSSLYE
jgi:hypothetical protein